MPRYSQNRIVAFFQRRASQGEKLQADVEKHGARHGGSLFQVMPSEAKPHGAGPRPRDKSGHEIPPPPVYVRSDPPGPIPMRQRQITDNRAYAGTSSGQDFRGGPEFSAPGPPGVRARFERSAMVLRRFVTQDEPPPNPPNPNRLIGFFGTSWSNWHRDDPPDNRPDRTPWPGESGGGGGGQSFGGPPSGHWGSDGMWHDD